MRSTRFLMNALIVWRHPLANSTKCLWWRGSRFPCIDWWGPWDWEIYLIITSFSELQQTQRTVLCIRRRKVRLKLNACGASRMQADGFYIYAETNLEDIVAQVEALNPDSWSTRTMTHPQAKWGCRKCVSRSWGDGNIDATSKAQSDCHLYCGSRDKRGSIGGPRMLEHMVDTVLYFEGDKHHSFRVLP